MNKAASPRAHDRRGEKRRSASSSESGQKATRARARAKMARGSWANTGSLKFIARLLKLICPGQTLPCSPAMAPSTCSASSTLAARKKTKDTATHSRVTA